mgnify:CR=1 FL=1
MNNKIFQVFLIVSLVLSSSTQIIAQQKISLYNIIQDCDLNKKDRIVENISIKQIINLKFMMLELRVLILRGLMVSRME